MDQAIKAPAPAGVEPAKRSALAGVYVQLAKDIFAGTCGGFAVTAVGHPFDTVKVRLQTQPATNPIYNGVFDCVGKTLKWEGINGLYKGVASPLAGQVFFRSVLFGAFGQSKTWLGKNADGSPRTLSMADFYKAGAITGGIAAFAEGPIDFYKSQIQVQIIRSKVDPKYVPPYTKVFQCVKATIAQSGIKGPFQGLGATLIRNIPANSLYLGTFEALKRVQAERRGIAVKDLPAAPVLMAGAAGGFLYWFVIYPVDMVKSAMQTDHIDPAKRRYKSMVDTVQKLYAEGGYGRFYKGYSVCMARSMPANAVVLYTVDKVQVMMRNL